MEFRRSKEKGYIWKEVGVTTQERGGGEVGTLLLPNDKSNIADKVLSYF